MIPQVPKKKEEQPPPLFAVAEVKEAKQALLTGIEEQKERAE